MLRKTIDGSRLKQDKERSGQLQHKVKVPPSAQMNRNDNTHYVKAILFTQPIKYVQDYIHFKQKFQGVVIG